MRKKGEDQDKARAVGLMASWSMRMTFNFLVKIISFPNLTKEKFPKA